MTAIMMIQMMRRSRRKRAATRTVTGEVTVKSITTQKTAVQSVMVAMSVLEK
jgi:hypothetical protein